MSMLKLYDLTENYGIEFKHDFDRFNRLQRVHHWIANNSYVKMDICTDGTGRLFITKRLADFNNKTASMEVIEVELLDKN